MKAAANNPNAVTAIAIGLEIAASASEKPLTATKTGPIAAKTAATWITVFCMAGSNFSNLSTRPSTKPSSFWTILPRSKALTIAPPNAISA